MKLFGIILFLLFPALVFAQADLIPIKQVGPSTYPATARAVRASGEVTIALTINAEGNVVASKATNGHPLLRAVSEQAVRFWKYAEAGIGSAHRETTVYLIYSTDNEFRAIPESDKPREFIAETFFSDASHGTVYSITLVPKLLRLPRKDGAIESKRCPLHDNELSVEIRKFSCSTDDESRFEPKTGYLDVYDELFPFAASPDRDDCDSDGIEWREVEYCANCRIARNNWLQINKK